VPAEQQSPLKLFRAYSSWPTNAGMSGNTQIDHDEFPL
jgi:hypothetical protein